MLPVPGMEASVGELKSTPAARRTDHPPALVMRALSPKTLFRLLALGRTFDLTLPDPKLEILARSLLPPDFRAQLDPALTK